VNAVTIDSLLDSAPPPDFIKIDVEGSAAAVLRGSRKIIRENSPVFFLELHGPEEQAGVADELVWCSYIAETIAAKESLIRGSHGTAPFAATIRADSPWRSRIMKEAVLPRRSIEIFPRLSRDLELPWYAASRHRAALPPAKRWSARPLSA
jgi:methyltransferase FkbM-like protein